jgi:hypothetical protein
MNFSFWNSSGALNVVVNVIDYAGPLVELIIGIFAWKNLRNRSDETSRSRGETAIVFLAILAALLWVTDTRLNHRLSVLQQTEANNRVVRLDPRNQPVTTVAASGSLTVSGFDLYKISRTSGPFFLDFHQRGTPQNIPLVSFDRDEMLPVSSNECWMNFK